MNMNRKFYIIIALLALSFHLSGQSDRLKTVETRDSASMVAFDTTGTSLSGTNVQEAIVELDGNTSGFSPGSIIFTGLEGKLAESNYRLFYDSMNTTLMIGANDNASSTRSLYVKKHLAGTPWAGYAYICNDTTDCNNSSVVMSVTRPQEPYRGGNEWNFQGYGKTPAINLIGNIRNPVATTAGSGTAGMSFGMRDLTSGSVQPLTAKPAFIFYNGLDGFLAPYNMCMVVGAGRRTGTQETNITGGHDVEFPFYTTSRNDVGTDPNVSHIYYPDQYGHMLLTLYGNGLVANPATGTNTSVNTALSNVYDYSHNGTAFATTDGSGDVTVTIGATMPDATYTVLLAAQGGTFQHPQVQSRTETNFVVRFFDAAGAPITGFGVVLDWEVRER